MTIASMATMKGGISRKISASGVRVSPLMTNSNRPCGGKRQADHHIEHDHDAEMNEIDVKSLRDRHQQRHDH